MEIRGLTPVDTLYEYSGHSIGLVFGNYLLWSGYVLAFVVAAAVVRLYYVGSLRGTYADLATYPVYILILLLLLWPIELELAGPGSRTVVPDGKGGFASAREGIFWLPDVTTVEGQERLAERHTVRVPRILAFAGALADALQGALIEDLGRGVYFSNFEWLRISEVNERSRILDPDLRHDVGVYLAHCYWPAVAARPEREDERPWDLVPLAGLGIDGWLLGEYERLPETYWTTEPTTSYPNEPLVRCSALHAKLSERIERHLREEAFHREAVEGFARLAEAEGNRALSGDAYARFYRRRLLYNEVFVAASREALAVRHALPEFRLLAEGGGWNYAHLRVSNLKELTSDSTWDRVRGIVSDLPGVLAGLTAGISEWWAQKTVGPATYYRVSALGPYVYGMVIAFLLMLFPVAGLMAFWPRGWTALVNFMKVFLSVKLWPIFWSYLSAMLAYRGMFNPEDPEGFQGTFGHEGMLPAFAGMYLVVPILSYIAVSLASQAGAVTMGGLVGTGASGSLLAGLGIVKSVGEGIAGGRGGAVQIGSSRSAPPPGR